LTVLLLIRVVPPLAPARALELVAAELPPLSPALPDAPPSLVPPPLVVPEPPEFSQPTRNAVRVRTNA
jgi:hypothetical protein